MNVNKGVSDNEVLLGIYQWRRLFNISIVECVICRCLRLRNNLEPCINCAINLLESHLGTRNSWVNFESYDNSDIKEWCGNLALEQNWSVTSHREI